MYRNNREQATSKYIDYFKINIRRNINIHERARVFGPRGGRIKHGGAILMERTAMEISRIVKAMRKDSRNSADYF